MNKACRFSDCSSSWSSHRAASSWNRETHRVQDVHAGLHNIFFLRQGLTYQPFQLHFEINMNRKQRLNLKLWSLPTWKSANFLYGCCSFYSWYFVSLTMWKKSTSCKTDLEEMNKWYFHTFGCQIYQADFVQQVESHD